MPDGKFLPGKDIVFSDREKVYRKKLMSGGAFTFMKSGYCRNCLWTKNGEGGLMFLKGFPMIGTVTGCFVLFEGSCFYVIYKKSPVEDEGT